MLRVKFVAKGARKEHTAVWRRQLPGSSAVLGECEFVFDPECQQYDWLVVYDDLPPAGQERFSTRVENLACASQNTLFITAEPSTIKVYPKGFLDQFGWILTSQEAFAVGNLQQVIYSQPALRWFVGVPQGWQDDPGLLCDWDCLAAKDLSRKQPLLTTVTSDKAMKNTEHAGRLGFVRALRDDMPEFKLFGRGIQSVDDKAEALDPYQYHLAIENHICPHHITEKLSDAFLAGCLPFYYGAPNVFDYFPRESLIPVDINDYQVAREQIRSAIAGDEYTKRYGAIMHARELVLNKYNLFAVIVEHIRAHHQQSVGQTGVVIASRHKYRQQHPLSAIQEKWTRYRSRRRRKEGVSAI